MALTFDPIAPPAFEALSAEDQALCRRVRAEYREMPGLTLTLPQAARLFNLDVIRCERLLDVLVASGSLAIRGGLFASARGARR